MSTHEFRKHTHSLYSLGQLIRFSGRDIKHTLHDFEDLVEKLQGEHTEEDIKKMVEAFNALVSGIEQIKKYDRRIEHQEITRFSEFVILAIHDRLVGLVGTRPEDENARRKIRELIDYAIDILREERINERRLMKDRHPKGSTWDNIMKSDVKLAREQVHAGTLADHLENQSDSIYQSLGEAIHYVKSKGGSISEPEFHHITNLILSLVDIIMEELKLELDIERNAENEEFRLERDLQELKKKAPDLKVSIEKLEQHYFDLVRVDYRESKRMQRLEKRTLGEAIKDLREIEHVAV